MNGKCHDGTRYYPDHLPCFFPEAHYKFIIFGRFSGYLHLARLPIAFRDNSDIIVQDFCGGLQLRVQLRNCIGFPFKVEFIDSAHQKSDAKVVIYGKQKSVSAFC